MFLPLLDLRVESFGKECMCVTLLDLRIESFGKECIVNKKEIYSSANIHLY
jgi:hypothetical protein